MWIRCTQYFHHNNRHHNNNAENAQVWCAHSTGSNFPDRLHIIKIGDISNIQRAATPGIGPNHNKVFSYNRMSSQMCNKSLTFNRQLLPESVAHQNKIIPQTQIIKRHATHGQLLPEDAHQQDHVIHTKPSHMKQHLLHSTGSNSWNRLHMTTRHTAHITATAKQRQNTIKWHQRTLLHMDVAVMSTHNRTTDESKWP